MLKIENLSCGYNSQFILSNINLQVKRGELLGIIGPNGAGKTTLIRAISRVIKPLKGNIFLQGENIYRINLKDFFKKVAIVSADLDCKNIMKVKDFILLGRIPHYQKFQFLESKRDLEVLEEVLRLTQTERFKERFLCELSSGEKQLVFIAQALAQESQLLILDEPVAHLDIAHQIEILDLLTRLNQELNLTIIMTLHNLNLASEYCQRIVLLSEGKIFKAGTPQEVISSEVIEKVYKTKVLVKENPLTSKPYIFLILHKERRNNERFN